MEASLVESIAGGMPTNDQVRALEAVMGGMLSAAGVDEFVLQPQVLTHGEVAARAVLIPAGTLLTGCETNFDNLCIVLGDITVTTDDGARRVTGFAMLPANRGTKRVGHAHADTWWITCHHTTLTNQRDIEDEMTNESQDLNSRRAVCLDAARDMLQIAQQIVGGA